MNDNVINDMEQFFPKSAFEFDLGINLAAFIDFYFNPDLYTQEMRKGMLEHGRLIIEVWKERYNEELEAIIKNDKNIGDR